MIDKAVAMNPNDMELRLAQAKLAFDGRHSSRPLKTWHTLQ